MIFTWLQVLHTYNVLGMEAGILNASHLILTTVMQTEYYESYFMKELEVERGKLLCQGFKVSHEQVPQ